MKDLIIAARPKQWTKNLLVFAGLIFSGKFDEAPPVVLVTLTFFAFCLVSSAGYMLNDILDKEADARHPKKRNRPIAAGRISTITAAIAAIVLLIVGVGVALSIPYYAKAAITKDAANYYALIAIGLYGANQFVYALIGRKVAILDVFMIAFGFLIRAIAGAAVIEVRISPWLLLCTLLLALFLGFAKRRNEMLVAASSRDALAGYSMQLIDQLIAICAGASVIAYSLYAIQSRNAQTHPLLAMTIPFPMFGIFRYLWITYYKNDSGSPDAILLKDPWIWGTVILWIISSILALQHPGWEPY